MNESHLNRRHVGLSNRVSLACFITQHTQEDLFLQKKKDTVSKYPAVFPPQTEQSKFRLKLMNDDELDSKNMFVMCAVIWKPVILDL